jgi:hypothetical protein
MAFHKTSSRRRDTNYGALTYCGAVISAANPVTKFWGSVSCELCLKYKRKYNGPRGTAHIPGVM